MIVLNGDSGTGKTTMLDFVEKTFKNVVPIKKYTTRQPRNFERGTETSDLYLARSKTEVTSYAYHYTYRSSDYSINKKSIDDVLSLNKFPLVIIRDCKILDQLKSDYSDCAVIYIYGTLKNKQLEQRLNRQGRTREEQKYITRAASKQLNDYVYNLKNNIYDSVIINDYTGLFHAQIRYHIARIINS